MKYTIKKKFTFEAAHRLPHHDGKCQRLHGHSWVGWIVISASKLHGEGPKQDMVVDFGDIKAAVKPLLDEHLDHYYLNESLNLENPTCEAVARWVFDMLEPTFGQMLVGIVIEETCTSSCFYHRPCYKASILDCQDTQQG